MSRFWNGKNYPEFLCRKGGENIVGGKWQEVGVFPHNLWFNIFNPEINQICKAMN